MEHTHPTDYFPFLGEAPDPNGLSPAAGGAGVASSGPRGAEVFLTDRLQGILKSGLFTIAGYGSGPCGWIGPGCAGQPGVSLKAEAQSGC